MTQKKQRPQSQQYPPAQARSAVAGRVAAGVVPAGREVFAEFTPRRRSEDTLRRMGLETALDTVNRLERGGDDDRAAARALRAWVNIDPAEVGAILRSMSTRGGESRQLRLSMCGVAFLARRAGHVSFARRACKDRVCPFCSARRSRMFAAALRLYLSGVPYAWRCFVTLTQPKRPAARWDETLGRYVGESPREAMNRLLASWRRFIEKFAKRLLRGGLRSMEVTARKAGQVVNGYEVKYPGLHAHLHCILDPHRFALRRVLRRPMREHRGGVMDRGEARVRAGRCGGRRGDLDRRPRVNLLAAAWCASSPGSSVVGVDVQDVTEANVYQCAKYAVDFSGLCEVVDGAPGYVRSVLQALHGRRTVAAFGSWKGADLGLREKKGSLEYGDRALYTLGATHPREQAPVYWSGGEVEPAEDVLRELLAAIARGEVEPL